MSHPTNDAHPPPYLERLPSSSTEHHRTPAYSGSSPAQICEAIVCRIRALPSFECSAPNEAWDATATMVVRESLETSTARRQSGELRKESLVRTILQHLAFGHRLVGIGDVHPQADRREYSAEVGKDNWMSRSSTQTSHSRGCKRRIESNKSVLADEQIDRFSIAVALCRGRGEYPICEKHQRATSLRRWSFSIRNIR